MRIFIIGYFGFNNNQLDGQTVKTRNILSLLEEKYFGDNLIYFDTQGLKSNPFLFFVMIYKSFFVNKVVYLPGKNNLHYLFPFLYFISKIFKFDIIYVVVGGWLVDYILKNKYRLFMFLGLKAILVETKNMRDILNTHFYLNNVLEFPNFRILQNESFVHLDESDLDLMNDTFRIVFVGRLVKEKGIDVIFRFLAFYNSNAEKYLKKVEVYFYGQFFDNEYQAFFFENIKLFPNAFYRGVLQPNEVLSSLKSYEVLVLPTRYNGEGFPGVIIEAYLAGIPVIVSNWMYLSEFVIHRETGYIFDLETESDFYNYILELVNDNLLHNKMKQHALENSLKYTQHSAWNILSKFIN